MNHRDTESTEDDEEKSAMVFQSLFDLFKARDAKPLPPAVASDVAGFEARFGCPIPEELRCYFSIFNGNGNSYDDEECIAFWSLENLAPISGWSSDAVTFLQDHKDWVIFADHSIGVLYYLVNLKDLRVITYSPSMVEKKLFRREVHPPSICAEFPSFAMFIKAYIRGGFAGVS